MQTALTPERSSRNAPGAFVSEDYNTEASGLHAGQTRGVQQASLDNISQAMSRR